LIPFIGLHETATGHAPPTSHKLGHSSLLFKELVNKADVVVVDLNIRCAIY
jgi:hypothetical protein